MRLDISGNDSNPSEYMISDLTPRFDFRFAHHWYGSSSRSRAMFVIT